MAWPDNTPVIDTTNFLNDSGTVTGASGARNELVTLINRLNQALDSIDAGDTPYTNNNSADLMKKLAVGTNQDICLLDGNGYPIRAAKTISTSVGSTDATVPTGKAVQTYVGQNGGVSESSTVSLPLDTGGTNAISHGLGTYPDLVTAWLQCTTADGDYIVNDRIYFNGCMFSSNGDYGTSNFSSIVVNASSSLLRISYDESGIVDTFGVADKFGGASILLDKDDWTIYARAYKI